MIERGQVERAAKRAIARAKSRGTADVTPDDLLLGALGEISRFGIAWIGERAVDLHRLSGNGEATSSAETQASSGAAPAYSAASVELLERAAGLAREDGAVNMGLVHLLAAFPEVECELLAEIFREHGISGVQWRAELARGVVGSPPRVASDDAGRSDSAPRRPGGPEILSVDEAAEYLGVHSQTVRNYIRSGKLPAYRLAGERYIRVLRKDLLALLERVETEESEETEETTRTEGGG